MVFTYKQKLLYWNLKENWSINWHVGLDHGLSAWQLFLLFVIVVWKQEWVSTMIISFKRGYVTCLTWKTAVVSLKELTEIALSSWSRMRCVIFRVFGSSTEKAWVVMTKPRGTACRIHHRKNISRCNQCGERAKALCDFWRVERALLHSSNWYPIWCACARHKTVKESAFFVQHSTTSSCSHYTCSLCVSGLTLPLARWIFKICPDQTIRESFVAVAICCHRRSLCKLR